MKHLRRILVRLYLLFVNSRVEAELAREIEAHLALLEDEYLRQGMTPADARRAARIACWRRFNLQISLSLSPT